MKPTISTFTDITETKQTNDINTSEVESNNNSTWKECAFCAFNLILYDLIWGIVASTIAILIVVTKKILPNYDLCKAFQKESNSEKSFQLLNAHHLIDIFWVFCYASIPLTTFLLIQSNKNNPFFYFPQTSNHKFNKTIKAFFFFALIDTLYRILFFFSLFVQQK